MSEQGMTAEERARRDVLVSEIRRSVQAFAETGRKLAEIREARLYRDTHATFEVFCRDTFDMTHRHVNRLIEAVAVVDALGPMVPPKTESQARELAPLREDPEAMRAVWQEANEIAQGCQRPVMAEDVRQARKARLAPDEPQEAPTGARGHLSVVADQPPVDPNDMRFMNVEDAVQALRAMPALDRLVMPSQPGDVEAFDANVRWLAEFAPKLLRAWRAHRKRTRAA